MILCLDSSFTTRAMLSTSPLKVFHDLSNTVNIQLIFSIFLSRLIFHSNCHHLMCYCFMYLCPVSPFKYKSRKEGILFFYCYTSELRKIPDFRQTTQCLMKEGYQGLAKHKAGVTFQEWHVCIGFNLWYKIRKITPKRLQRANISSQNKAN